MSQNLLNIIITCFQCGTCNASCPVRMVTDEFNPVKISRMILLGFEEEIIKSPIIWLCADCGSCIERCPRKIPFVDLIKDLQNKAVKKGNVPESLKKVAKLLLEKGWAYDLETYEFIRSDLKLPILKANTEAIKKLAELVKLQV